MTHKNEPPAYFNSTRTLTACTARRLALFAGGWDWITFIIVVNLKDRSNSINGANPTRQVLACKRSPTGLQSGTFLDTL
jgi:hypothetical protein